MLHNLFYLTLFKLVPKASSGCRVPIPVIFLFYIICFRSDILSRREAAPFSRMQNEIVSNFAMFLSICSYWNFNYVF